MKESCCPPRLVGNLDFRSRRTCSAGMASRYAQFRVFDAQNVLVSMSDSILGRVAAFYCSRCDCAKSTEQQKNSQHLNETASFCL